MSTTVDNRVVEMRFDNKQFEAGVATSLNTLGQLKKGLDLNDSIKSFDALSHAARKCDISSLGQAAQAVSSNFSALEVMAVGALLRIGSQAAMAGEKLLKSLTIEPITTGFSEYELKMGSIQTIMASTGESLDRVNQKLDELNKYSDRTIYSFSDMTSNIGKFTNAGVKLDDAVAAIQGVSNVAAISGANANEASRAMYNFAQALSAGYVKLIDWKSIENANMATVEFKTQLLESAVAAGTLTKTANGMYKTLAKGTVIDATHLFNDSLQEQWMTTDVLTRTLKDYANETTEIGKKAFAAAQDVKTWTQLLDTLKESAQSGWAETWQLVTGDYEEAKATLRSFSEFFSGIIDGSSEARNVLLKSAFMSSWGQLKDRVSETGISVDSFRDILRETAEGSVAGLNEMIEKAGSFDAAVSKGWLTGDILADTLDNLISKAMGTQATISELSDEQLKNVGYTQNQIDALRTLSHEAKLSDSAISTLIKTMGRQSGRELLFDSILNVAKAVLGLFKTIKGAWQEVFPPIASEQIYSFIEALHSASERIRNFFIQAESGADGFTTSINKPLQDIRSAFKGIFAVLDIVKEAFSALWRVLAPTGSTFGDLLSVVLSLTGSFGEWLVNLDAIIKENDIFYKGIKTVVDYISNAIDTVKRFGIAIAKILHLPSFSEAIASIQAFISAVQEKIGAPGLEFLRELFEGLCTRAKQVRNAVVGMKNAIVDSMDKTDRAVAKNTLIQTLSGIWNLIKTVASAVGGLLSKAFDMLIESLSNLNFNTILDFLNALAAGGLIATFKKFLDPMNEMKDCFSGFIGWIKGFGSGINKILDNVRGSLEAWQTKLKADALGKIAASVAVLSVALLVLSSIDSDKIAGSLVAITALFADLSVSMAVLDKLKINGNGMKKISSAMISISAALLILSFAMKNLGELNPEQLTVGLIGIGVLLAELSVFMNTAKFSKGAVKTATGMILFASTIKILASVVKDLAALSWEDMTKGLIGVGILLAEVDVFLNTAKLSGKAVLTATGIILLASAMKILASVCKDFSTMSWGEIEKGLVSVGVLLTEITAFTRLTGDAKHVVATGFALIEIGAAMKIFASATRDFGRMSWGEIAKGLVAIGGALAELTISLNLMPKNIIGLGVGLIAVGAALKIISHVLGTMGEMSWDEITKGLVALGGALAELSIGLNLMNGTLAGSAALLVAAAALAIFTPSLKALGNMTWESIAKGLISIAGAFAVIGVASAVLSPLIPLILGLSAALALVGVSSIAIGAGLMLIGTGFTTIAIGIASLSTSFATSGAVIIAGLSSIILGVAALIPAIAEKIGEAIVAFCGVIASGASSVANAVKTVVLSLVDVLVTCIPKVADGALRLAVGVLAALVAYTPQLVDSLMQFLIEVLEGVARNMPQLIQAAMDVVGAFFTGLLDALGNIDLDTFIKTLGAVGLLTGIVAALGLVAGLIPSAMVGVLGLGAVVAELALVLAAVGGLAQIPGLEWLISEGGNLLETIGTAIGGFVGGIAGGFLNGVSGSFPQIGSDLSAFMTNVKPFIDGASGITPKLINGVKDLASAILLITAADFLNGITSLLTGGTSLSDFGNELVPFGRALAIFSLVDSVNLSMVVSQVRSIVDFAKNIKNVDVTNLSGFGDALQNLAESTKMFDLSDTIKKTENSVKNAMFMVVNGALSVVGGFKDQFYSVGINVGTGFVDGIKSRVSIATNAGYELGRAALNAAKRALDSHSPSREFIYLGENIGEGLAIGVNNSIVPAANATSEMIDEVLKVAGKGVDAYENWVSEKKYYDELSLKDELAGWEKLQSRYTEGSKNRTKIDREVYRLQNALVSATYQASIDWIETEKFYKRLSTQEELAAYERMQTRYMEGSKERIEIDKKIFELRNKLIEESYQSSVDWIETEKFYKRLSTKEELETYEQMLDEYEEGSKERIEIDKKIFELRNKVVEESYQFSMDWIEEEKYYNRMSLADELAAYRRVQSRYAQGTEERKKMDREVYRLEKEIYEAQKQYISDVEALQKDAAQKRIDAEENYADKVKSINEQLARDVEAESNRYLDAVESRANTLYRSYGLFDAVSEREAISGDVLIGNLEDQVKEFDEWQNILDSLSARGVESGLISELQEMGPSSIAQIRALESMTDDELNKYVSLWQVKHGMARSRAVSELEDLNTETQSNIAKLRETADQELEEYRLVWLETLETINADANNSLTKLQREFAEKIGLIKKDTEQEMHDMADSIWKIMSMTGWDEVGQRLEANMEGLGDWQEYVSSLATLNAESGTSLKKDFASNLGQIAEIVEQGLQKTVDVSQNAGTTVVSNTGKTLEQYKAVWQKYLTGVNGDVNKKLTALHNDISERLSAIKKTSEGEVRSLVNSIQKIIRSVGWNETGRHIVEGLVAGIEFEKSSFLNSLVDMAVSGVRAVEKALGIASPSKVFEELGQFTGLGFVMGVSDYAEKSYDAGSAIAEEAKFGLSDAMRTIVDYLNGDLEAQPTIRPVLDLTNVSNGIGQMDTLFRNHRLLALAGQTSLAFSSNTRDSEMRINVNNDGVVQELRSLRSEMAEMTNRITRMQVVLDTGVLVGETAGLMDSELGRRQVYRGRGN